MGISWIVSVLLDVHLFSNLQLRGNETWIRVISISPRGCFHEETRTKQVGGCSTILKINIAVKEEGKLSQSMGRGTWVRLEDIAPIQLIYHGEREQRWKSTFLQVMIQNAEPRVLIG